MMEKYFLSVDLAFRIPMTLLVLFILFVVAYIKYIDRKIARKKA